MAISKAQRNRLTIAVDILDRRIAELHERVDRLHKGSYTTKLLQGGILKKGSKILAESHDVIDASSEADRSRGYRSPNLQCDPSTVDAIRESRQSYRLFAYTTADAS